jgi:hypothetical protein
MSTRRAHRWIQQSCTRCGLRRREAWILDSAGREVMALVWTGRTGDQQIQPFPPMKGLEPPGSPPRPLAEAFPDVPVGPEPPCLRPPRKRTRKSAEPSAPAPS